MKGYLCVTDLEALEPVEDKDKGHIIRVVDRADYNPDRDRLATYEEIIFFYDCNPTEDESGYYLDGEKRGKRYQQKTDKK